MRLIIVRVEHHLFDVVVFPVVELEELVANKNCIKECFEVSLLSCGM